MTIRVLAHVSSEILDRIVGGIPGVEMIEIPREGPIPEGIEGEVLLTFPWATPNAGEALSHVKRGIHLVNVSRGSLVDQDALREALDDGRVACASLDTVEPEPLPAGHWLYTHPRVRLSPHISWNMPDGLDRIFETFGDNLRRFGAGEPLEGAVDPTRGY